MSLSGSRLRWAGRSAAFALIAGLSITICSAGEPDNAKPAASSTGSTKSTKPTKSSELDPVDRLKSPFQRLEDDIFRPFDLPNLENPVHGGGPMPIMPAPAPLTRQQQEMQDRRKNWAFIDPDEILGKSSFDDPLHPKEPGTGGTDPAQRSVIEQYFEKANARRTPAARDLGLLPGAGSNFDFAGTNMFNPRNFAFSTNGVPFWAQPSQGASVNSADPTSGASSSPGDQALTPVEQARALKHRLEFNALLEGRYPKTPSSFSKPGDFPTASGFPNTSQMTGGLLNNLNPSASNPPAPSPAANAPAVEYRNAANPILGASIQPPSLRPPELENPTLRALGLPQPQVKQPESSRMKLPDAVQIQSGPPQRKF